MNPPVGLVRLWVDGACRGNPGPASIGGHLEDADGSVVLEISERLGHSTNNIAEYTALIRALEEALALGATEVEAFSDSLLLVKQMAGEYRVKHPNLKPLHAKALGLARGFARFAFAHVPREENRAADRLANLALDRAGG